MKPTKKCEKCEEFYFESAKSFRRRIEVLKKRIKVLEDRLKVGKDEN